MEVCRRLALHFLLRPRARFQQLQTQLLRQPGGQRKGPAPRRRKLVSFYGIVLRSFRPVMSFLRLLQARGIWRGSNKAAPSSRTADVHHVAVALGCIRIDKSRYQQPTIDGNDLAILFSTSRSGWTDIVFPARTAF